jgi:hypothetical protein
VEGQGWVNEKLVVDQICLTLQSPNMISVIEAELGLHLRICSLDKFVIFHPKFRVFYLKAIRSHFLFVPFGFY